MTGFIIAVCGAFFLGAFWQRVLLVDNMRSHVDRMIEERERSYLSGFFVTPDSRHARRV